MASPAEIGQNLPDTLPADFGEWDTADSPATLPAEPPKNEPRELAPKDATPGETTQKDFARREADAIDIAAKNFTPREVVARAAAVEEPTSRDFESARSVVAFPEPDATPMIPRGYPTPIARAPRTTTLPSALPSASYPDEAAFIKRIKSLNTVVDKLPPVSARVEHLSAANVSVLEPAQNKPIFTAAALEESPANEEEEATSTTLFIDGIEDEEERRVRRKWIMSIGLFACAILLAVFQLIHYGTVGMLRHMVQTPRSMTKSAESLPITSTLEKASAAHPQEVKRQNAAGTQPAKSAQDTATQDETAPAPVQTQMMHDQLMAPTRLPQSIKSVSTSDAPPTTQIAGTSMAALNGNGTVNNVFAGEQNTKVSGPKVLNVSAGVAMGMLTHKTQPIYPPIAKAARVQGTVVIHATISKTGVVSNPQAVSGPAMLRQAALDAVKTWRYKPYLLNNQPTEVDTTINVVFALGG